LFEYFIHKADDSRSEDPDKMLNKGRKESSSQQVNDRKKRHWKMCVHTTQRISWQSTNAWNWNQRGRSI